MNFLLHFHAWVLETAGPAFHWLIRHRLSQGKEDASRVSERMGMPGIKRPSGPLLWIHGASVGEAQSTLIIIDQIKQNYPQVSILLTTGTVSSTRYLENRLPSGVVHQYYPLDRPRWVEHFLSHWQPDFVLWMESELWPSMLMGLQKRKTPVIMVNGRMSPRSLKRWQSFSRTIGILLRTFQKILVQTDTDKASYVSLGAKDVFVTGNLKYAAKALSVDDREYDAMRNAIDHRPVWVYASTHKGEEEIACHVHKTLAAAFPDLLTIIVPRHPERRDEIVVSCQKSDLKTQLRSIDKKPPLSDTQIYIADTLGELGLFYRLSPVACIGRSFSDDGGGGHNPIEGAQLHCAVVHGPHVQNLQAIYHDMDQIGAARLVHNKEELAATISTLLKDKEERQKLADAGFDFTQTQSIVLKHILDEIFPSITVSLGHKAQAA